MHIRNYHIPVLLMIGIFALSSCKTKTNELNMPGYELERGEIEISEQAMDEIIENVSSPIEIAALIKDLGIPFNSKYLSDPDRMNSYNTSFDMAFNLGMLGADLGYLNVYEKTGNVVHYLTTINKLADGLKVSQFYDFNTLKRLASESTNLDSLMFLSVRSFNQMDDHLRDTDRSNLSALMIAGIWMEGMYQATQVVNEKADPLLAEYIGEQKLILNDLLLILKNYEKDDQFKALIKDFETIKNEFDKVEISYEMGEPEMKEEDGMLVVVQQERSVVNISNEVLDNIIKVNKKIRNSHLSVEK